MADIAMPRLSDSMQEGTILRWLKSDGDEVSKGDEIVEIETDKANMTYQADAEGVLEIVAGQGATLAVGETIARIGGGERGEESESAPAATAEGQSEQAAAAEESARAAAEGESEPATSESQPGSEPEPTRAQAGTAPPATQPAPPRAGAQRTSSIGEGNGRVKASPIARRLARDRGLELAALHGTGPGGRIVKADVEAAAARGDGEPAEAPPGPSPEPEEPAAAPVPPAVVSGEQGRGETEVVEPTRLQRTVARRMAESKATAPDFVLTVEVDMEAAVELRAQLEAAAGDAPAPTVNDLVLKASALALRDAPRANAAYRDGRFELYSRVNVGIAVAGMDALVVPTIFDADRKSLGQLAREARALAERARAGAITPPELSAGTFTVSNLGMYGIRRFTAVINAPQAAILAVGELAPRAVVRDGEIQARHVLELTLACDHRILYGADAAGFLARIREYLEQPLRLAL